MDELELEQQPNNESGKEQAEDEGTSAAIKAIIEMKKDYVPKTALEKVKAENKQLLDALIKGEQIKVEQPAEVDINELRKELFTRDNNLSNLDYTKKVLQLREALIEKGEKDPFLPVGDKVDLKPEHYEQAQRVADGLQHCVDFADGDSGVFTAEYQRIVKDPVLPGLAAKRNRK